MAENVIATRSASTSHSAMNRADRSRRVVQAILLLILLGCCGASAYLFMISFGVIETSDTGSYMPPPMADPKIGEEGKELDGTTNDLTIMGKATSMAMQTALLAEISGKLPMAPAEALSPTIAAPVGPGEGEVIIEPDPPQVTVIAIMITDKDKIAMIDVLGEDGGLIVRQGSKFSEGTARVTKIDAKGVTFTWMKKSYTVVM